MKNDEFIEYMIETVTTKAKLEKALSLLEQFNVDVFEVSSKNLNQFSILVFKYLKSPTDEHKNLMTQLYHHKNVIKTSLEYYVSSNDFGRELLKASEPAKDAFEAIYTRGNVSELKDFIKNNDIKSLDLQKTKHYNLNKAILLAQAGVKFTANNLSDVIESEDKMKCPAKLLDFTLSQRHHISPDAWDKLIIDLIRKTNNSNWDWHKSNIADTWCLFSYLNEPEKQKSDRLISTDNVLNPDALYFNPQHKNMSRDDFATTYIPYFFKLRSFIRSEDYYKAVEYFSSTQIKELIKINFTPLMSKKLYGLEVDAHIKSLLKVSRVCHELLDSTLKAQSSKKFKEVCEFIRFNNAHSSNHIKSYLSSLPPSQIRDSIMSEAESLYSKKFLDLACALKLEVSLGEKPANKLKKI